MTKRTIFILLLFGLIFNLKAQNNFRKGYIVNFEHDTITGYVNYNTSLVNQRKCIFKKSLDDEPVEYTPPQLIAYGISNFRHYESKVLTLENSTEKRVFIEKIVSGKISLFKYNKIFYVQKEDTLFFSLEKKVVKNVYKEGKKGNIYINNHIGILLYLMSDKPELKNDINRTVLSERSLTSLISKYNLLMGAWNNTYKSSLKWTKFQFNIMGGYFFSKLHIISNEHGIDYLLDSWDAAYGPTFGASIDISSPHLNDRFKITVGASYFTTNYYAYHLQENASHKMISHVALHISTIGIPFGMKYTLPFKTVDLNFGIGLAVGLPLTQTSRLGQDIIQDNVTEYYSKENFLSTKRQETYWLSFGASKAIATKIDGFIEFRLEKGRGISDEITVEEESYDYKTWIYPHTTRPQLLIGISF